VPVLVAKNWLPLYTAVTVVVAVVGKLVVHTAVNGAAPGKTCVLHVAMTTPPAKNCTVPVITVCAPRFPPGKLGDMLVARNDTVAVKVTAPAPRELLPIAAPTSAPVGVPVRLVTVVAGAIVTVFVVVTGR